MRRVISPESIPVSHDPHAVSHVAASSPVFTGPHLIRPRLTSAAFRSSRLNLGTGPACKRQLSVGVKPCEHVLSNGLNTDRLTSSLAPGTIGRRFECRPFLTRAV